MDKKYLMNCESEYESSDEEGIEIDHNRSRDDKELVIYLEFKTNVQILFKLFRHKQMIPLKV